MRHGQRLLGVELYAERPGEAAAFYAWLLGPGSGGSPASWQPVSLLFEHAICGIHGLDPQGPPASWVPVVAVHGLDAACERAHAQGFRIVEHRDRCYMVDTHGLWTRLVDSAHIPLGIDPDALGNTIAEINVPTPRETLEAYARVLDLEIVEMIDDFADYHMLLEDGVLALGSVWYEPHSRCPIGPTWLVYFNVPDLELTVERAVQVDVRVAVPPTKEDFNVHAIVIDPFGMPFGFCTYFDTVESQMQVRRANGEELPFHDAVRLLVDPRD
jgi:predicted enzyme related to lactoylglutathione lyase